MKSYDLLRGRRGARIEAIESKLKKMLERDRHEVDLAMSVLLGDLAPAEANDEVRSSDQRVNEAEREIRRELVVHASVFGSIEIPCVLLYMSIVKDIERVGDYAKNLIDLALDGANLQQAPDFADWRALAAQVSAFVGDSTEAFHERDTTRTRTLIAQGDRLLTVFDDSVSALVKGADQDPSPVARALALRYLKRVVAHLVNVLTAVVMPLDCLDYLHELPKGRVRWANRHTPR